MIVFLCENIFKGYFAITETFLLTWDQLKIIFEMCIHIV